VTAARTTSTTLGTSVPDALFPSPVILARRPATLDRLGNGRLVAALGQGWMEQEFAAAGLTDRLRPAQDVAGDGFGFTWPAPFPVLRIDHVLVRGVEPTGSWVLPATGSDHLPVAARLRW
jgi:Luciferase-like monooxygenase